VVVDTFVAGEVLELLMPLTKYPPMLSHVPRVICNETCNIYQVLLCRCHQYNRSFYKQLSCRIETARCFVLLNISLSLTVTRLHSKLHSSVRRKSQSAAVQCSIQYYAALLNSNGLNYRENNGMLHSRTVSEMRYPASKNNSVKENRVMGRSSH